MCKHSSTLCMHYQAHFIVQATSHCPGLANLLACTCRLEVLGNPYIACSSEQSAFYNGLASTAVSVQCASRKQHRHAEATKLLLLSCRICRQKLGRIL